MSSKAVVEVELKSDVQKIWESINNFTNLFPKTFPQVFESAEAIEGDGNSVGSVRVIKYASGPLKTLTEKIELVDDDNKTMSYSVIDGDVLKFYKSFKGTLVASDKDDKTVVKYVCECEKLSEQSPDPNLISDFIVKSLHGLDAYLLSLKP